jgi:hypothetical protein
MPHSTPASESRGSCEQPGTVVVVVEGRKTVVVDTVVTVVLEVVVTPSVVVVGSSLLSLSS